MKKAIAILCLVLFCASCKNNEERTESGTAMKFDKEKWKIKHHITLYAFRDQMLQDLVKDIIKTKKERPMQKQEILEMLGEPAYVDSLTIFYEISQRKFGLLPVQATTLVVKFFEDETVDKVLIAE